LKPQLKKRTDIVASVTAVLVLLVVAGVLVTSGITREPTRGQKITISTDDLAEMKTLVYKYLNERTRMLISPEPEKDPNIAGAPTISPSEMSPELTKRQKEDVEKLKAETHLGTFKNFAILAHVLNIQEEGDKVVLHLGETTYFQVAQPGGPSDCSEGADYYFIFSRVGGRWILTDVKLPYAGTMPLATEPSVKPNEVGTDRVLADPPEETTVIPEKIKKLDGEATEKIKNGWAIDDQTAEAIRSGTYSW
jgi:Cu/Ag efflux protein CusF